MRQGTIHTLLDGGVNHADAPLCKRPEATRGEFSALQSFDHGRKGFTEARLSGCAQIAFAIEQHYPCAVVAPGLNQKAACPPDKSIGVFLMGDELIDTTNGPQDGIEVLEALLRGRGFGVALNG
jgi:hypothetical protein